jgi:hypothetical protein
MPFRFALGGQMNELLQQVHNAGRYARAGAMEDALRYIDEAWELLDDGLSKRPGPKASIRALRDYLSEARFAARKGNQFGVTQALDNVLRMLNEKPAKGT